MPPPPEDTGSLAQAASDQPGTHGAAQPWVRCRHRVKEEAVDPLGPVIAHGFKEAPGYEPELLDIAQRQFLRRASLRTRDDGGPNSVLYEDLDLPDSPSDVDIAHLVSGAIRLAGKRVPAEATVGLLHVSSPDDGAAHALPQFRIWDVMFREQGTVVSGALCQLIAPLGDPEGCEGVCAENAESCPADCAAAVTECTEGCGSDKECLKGCKKEGKSCSKACKKEAKDCAKMCTEALKLFDTATLTCRLPVGTEPLGFEPFAITQAQAELLANAARPPAFVAAWGSLGSGPGEIKWPVAVDGLGAVYVADLGNARIQKFDSDGNFLTEWGSLGTADGQFFRPMGVAVDSAGDVYVADHLNHRVQKFDPGGSFLGKWGSFGSGDGQFNVAYGLAVAATGDVYVADRLNHRVQKFDPGGGFLGKWGSLGSGDGELDEPTDIAIDGAGDVYVVDSGNDRVQKFSAAGAFLASWGSHGSAEGELSQPVGIAVDALGNVYVADADNSRIQKFTSSGVFLTSWGEWGQDEGLFDSVRGVAVDANGDIYAADTGNHRIQKFRPGPALITTSKRYEVDGEEALARYYVVTFDGQRELGAHIDGAGNLLSVTPRAADLHFEGWDLDYASKPLWQPLLKLDAPVDVGTGQDTHLDTLPVIASLTPVPSTYEAGSCLVDWLSAPPTFPGASPTTTGFVICGNDLYEKFGFLDPAAPLLTPRPPAGPGLDANDFTQDHPSLPGVLPIAWPLLGPGFASGLAQAARIPFGFFDSQSVWQELYLGANGSVVPIDVDKVNVAPWHHAELQAFYNAGALQQRYRYLGHPSFCAKNKLEPLIFLGDWCDPVDFCTSGNYSCDPDDPEIGDLLNQDPYRLEIKVHWREGNETMFHSRAQAGLHFLRLGDWQTQGLSSGDVIESVADMPFFHEYQHHILRSIEDMYGWETSSVLGPRDAIDEGLGDAFASLWTGHAYGPRGYQPVDPEPCSDASGLPPQ